MQTSTNTHSLFKRPLYQNTTLSLSRQAKIAPIYASVHYIKTLRFPYQNCVHMQVSTISSHYTKNCQHTFLMRVSTISKHYTFLIKIAPIYASVHYINTLHFSYTKNSHHTFLMQVSTISEHYTFPMQTCQNCVHMQVSTISQHCTFPITVHHIKSLHFSYANMPKLRPYASVHHIKWLHFSYTTVHHIKSLHFSYANMPKLRPNASVHYITALHFSHNCPPYQITTLFLCKHAKIASIDKCPPYQMASFFLHYCPPYTFSIQITTVVLVSSFARLS